MSLSRIAAGSAAVVVLAGSAVFAQGEPPFLWRRAATTPSSPSFGPEDTFWVANGRDCLLLRASDGHLLRSYDPGTSPNPNCLSANFSHDGRWVAVLYFNAVTILRASDWTPVASFFPHAARVAISPDDRSLVMCSGNQGDPSRIVDTATWTVRAQAAADCSSAFLEPWISVSPDSQLVAINQRIFRISDGANVTPPSGFSGGSFWLIGSR